MAGKNIFPAGIAVAKAVVPMTAVHRQVLCAACGSWTAAVRAGQAVGLDAVQLK